MIKPPAMGVFARDPPPAGRGGAPSSSSGAQSLSLPTDVSPANHIPSASSTIPTDQPPSDPAIPDDEAAQDDDDQEGTVDEEAGVIRCICGCDDDDGFTIQCDRCLVWQHCACFGMSQASVPDEYLCEQCEPRPVDVAFAQAHQQKRKNNEARKALMDRNLKRQQQALASAATYNQPHLSQDTVSSPTSLVLSLPTQESVPTHQQNTNHAPSPAAAARARKPSQALDLTNTQFVVPEIPASAGTAQRGAKQRKGHKGSRRGYDTPSAVSTPVRGVFTPGSSHDRADDPFDLADQLEAWHIEFTPIARNVVADPSVLEGLALAMLDWEDGSPLKAVPGPAGRVLAPTAPRSFTTAKLSHLESLAPSSSSTSSPSPSSPRALASPAPEAEPIGIAAVGHECVPVELTGACLADLACRTYVRHISESASAGVFSNLLYVNNSADEPQRSWSASRAFSRPVMHGLFADASIPAGAFISELRGELYSADAYRNDPINQYAALGATKPHVHLLPPPLNLAIDARRFGNEARFARYSCHPNAVLRPILFYPNGQPPARSRTASRAQSPASALASSARNNRYADTPPAESRSDEPQLLFGLFALTDISRTHEITVGWEWDDAHIVHFLPELVQNPYLESHGDDVDADQHTAHMVALAEKGEFPYADTEFSVKMSTVAAALLGCVLCACIGSAAPPGGGGGASANNGRKQDCAVAQMLRVGNGMSLLNVTMPGKTNRRAKLPDFSPLVGTRRHWRPISLPPTPDTSVKDAASPVDQALLAALAAEGESRTIKSLEEAAIQAEAGCGGNEAVASRRKGLKAGRSKKQRISMAGDDHRSGSAASDLDEHADDTRSIASSLTDPLSGLSDNDLLSDDDDQDLIDAVRVADGLQPLRRSAKGGDAVDAELPGLFLLPPKKRSMRTRIKAVMAPSDDDEASDDGDVQGAEDASTQVKALKSRRSADSISKSKSITKRKSKLDAGRAPIDFSSDEDEQFDASSAHTPAKRRRKAGNVVDPSSPLSSVPSPNSVDSTTSPPPAASRESVKRRLESERRMSDVELAKKKRAAKRGTGRNNESSKSRPKESASKRRKREEARIHRNAILDLGDTESSEEGLSEDVSDGDKQRLDDDDGDITMADVESRASTPRASNKGSDSQTRDAAPPGEGSQLTTDAILRKTKKQDKTAVLPTSEDRQPPQKDTVAKTKKVRRILSDSEASGDEKEMQSAASTPKMSEQDPSPLNTAEQPAAGEPVGPEAVAKPKIEEDAASAETTAASQAPALVPEVKKEEPRVKLSLAEYKRRLAERRVSGQQNTGSSAAPLTPTIATPSSEVGPSPSPAVERSDPALTLPVQSSEPTLMTTAAEAGSTPTGLVTPSKTHATDAAETSKASASVSRGMLFTSISAPTAIRSVEIPKSPSPEPATTASAQHQEGGAAPKSPIKDAVAALAEVSDTKVLVESAANSSLAGPASSPASNTSALPAVGASADTSALLMRLETRHNRAASAASAGEKDAQQVGITSSGASGSDADGFVRPLTVSSSQVTTPTAATFGSSAPLRSPSLGSTRGAHSQLGGRLPPSPSGSSNFNPPKAPRAFMSPPSNSLPPSSMLPASSSAANSTSTTAPSPSSASASGPGSGSAAVTHSASSAVTSTPARVGHTGAAAGVGNTPSTGSSASSAAASRYPAHGLTSPTPLSTALPANSSGGYAPRNFAGVPKGPASMRDTDPRAEAWAEAREAREVREARGDFPQRHYDAAREGAGRDMGWGERSRDLSGGMGEREGVRGGWGRERRDLAHARPGYRRDDPAYGRDDLGSAGGEIGGGGGDHSHYAPYRRPSATEYDDAVRGGVAGGGPVLPYDRPSDPYNRGIGIRGRSLGLGGPAPSGPGMNSSAGPPPPASGPPRDARGEYRDYDDVGGPVSGPQGHSHPRGGFRSGGGWGGRGRPRGRGHPDAGRGRGGWMR